MKERTKELLPKGTQADVGDSISAGLDRPRGLLRVSAPVLFARVALGRIAADLARACPGVRPEVTAEDRLTDPVEDSHDVVIRINPLADDRLVGRCFVDDERVVVAAGSLKRPLRGPGDSPSIPAVMLTSGSANPGWQVTNEGRIDSFSPHAILRLSPLLMVRDAVRAGAGAGLLPRFTVADDMEAGRLACWGSVADRPVSIWALHPSRRLVSTKVKAFLPCLADAFPNRAL